MTTVILAEKKDQGRHYMTALGIKHGPKSSKATGKTFLDPVTTVVCASGHLVNLGEPEIYSKRYKDRQDMSILPLIPDRFKYSVDKKQSFLFNQAVQELKKADTIIVGTDNDFEGGAIAFNILAFGGILKMHKKVLRSYPTAMEKKAILRQFRNLKPIDETWRQAQAAISRSRSDWLIGMNLSRLYTNKLADDNIYGNYAVGRTITATLNLICRWYEQINNFHEEPIYQMQGTIKVQNEDVVLNSPVRIVGDGQIDPKSEYLKLLKKHGLSKKVLQTIIKEITSQEKTTYPPILMTKGDLYKEMKKAHGWTQKKSESVMQQNYELGYQTYPRTDSGLINEDEYNYLGKLFDEYMAAIGASRETKAFKIPSEKVKKYLEKKPSAHLAIIPTEKIMPSEQQVDAYNAKIDKFNKENAAAIKAKTIKAKVPLKITKDQRKMYEVVVRRSLTIWQKPYKYVSNKIVADVNGIDFTASNSVQEDIGYKAILPRPKKKTKSKIKTGLNYSKYLNKEDTLPIKLKTLTSKTVPPKPLTSTQIFDKGGLMESAYKYIENKEYAKILKSVKGLGTSATRDAAMASLEDKGYVSVDKKDKITVTGNGWLINWLLQDTLISSPALTARWEEEYQKIANGEDDPNRLIKATEKLIENQFDKVENNWNASSVEEYYSKVNNKFLSKVALGQCPQCKQGNIIFKERGKFRGYVCTNSDCDFLIWEKFAPNKKLTENDVLKLISGKETRLIKGINSRKDKDKTYDCKLKLEYDSEQKKYILNRIFPTNDSKKAKWKDIRN